MTTTLLQIPRTVYEPGVYDFGPVPAGANLNLFTVRWDVLPVSAKPVMGIHVMACHSDKYRSHASGEVLGDGGAADLLPSLSYHFGTEGNARTLRFSHERTVVGIKLYVYEKIETALTLLGSVEPML